MTLQLFSRKQYWFLVVCTNSNLLDSIDIAILRFRNFHHLHTVVNEFFRTHWYAVYPSKRLPNTVRDYGKTCVASGEDLCTKSNSNNRTRIRYPPNYGTSSNRYMCTDSISFFEDNPQKPIKFAIYDFYIIITIIIIFYYERTKHNHVCFFFL